MVASNVKRILAELSAGVDLVAAAKGRSAQEILEAVEAGVRIVGENYVQDAEATYEAVGTRVKWHCIGHLQTNKVKRAARLFDLVQTVDSMSLAREMDRRCSEIGKVMPILVEINSADEKRKTGVLLQDAESLVREIASLHNTRVMGLMTMGAAGNRGECLRPFFAATKRVFDDLARLSLPNVEMKYLSMGMSDSYKVAVDEGANMVRLGKAIFGER